MIRTRLNVGRVGDAVTQKVVINNNPIAPVIRLIGIAKQSICPPDVTLNVKKL